MLYSHKENVFDNFSGSGTVTVGTVTSTPNREGLCYSSDECSKAGGSAQGSCASGYGSISMFNFKEYTPLELCLCLDLESAVSSLLRLLAPSTRTAHTSGMPSSPPPSPLLIPRQPLIKLTSAQRVSSKISQYLRSKMYITI